MADENKQANSPGVDVIILNWNGATVLPACLDSVISLDYPNLHIVVVDNASSDDSETVVQRYDNVSLIQNERNEGFARGNNIALRSLAQSSSPYVILLNNDMTVSPDFVRQLVDVAESDARIGAVSSQIRSSDAPPDFGLALTRMGMSRVIRDASNTGRIVAPCAGAALYRRAALDDVNIDGDYLDEDFAFYSEDFDLGLRLFSRNWTIRCASPAIAFHRASTSVRKRGRLFAAYHDRRNDLWVIAKDLPSDFIRRHWAPILAGQLGAIGLYACRFHPWTILRAKWHAVRGLKKMLAKRKEIQARRTTPTDRWFALVGSGR